MADDAPVKRQPNALNSPAILFATWFGAGLLPLMPGTWGSLAALPFAWALHMYFGWGALALATFAVFIVGLWAASSYIGQLGGDDPGPVVIDEVAGQWLTLIPAAYLAPQTPDLITYGVALALFRLTDIFKPWPASWADKKIHGGLGIMLDDILAGIYSAAGLAIFIIYVRP